MKLLRQSLLGILLLLCLMALPSYAMDNSMRVNDTPPTLTENETAPFSGDKQGFARILVRPATSVVHSHTTGATLTLTPTAGQYVYITGIDIQNCATGTAVTAAAPTYITTTNITGAPQYQIGSGVTAGDCQPVTVSGLSSPLRSTAISTAVTFVLPAFATNQVVSVNVYWYSAP